MRRNKLFAAFAAGLMVTAPIAAGSVWAKNDRRTDEGAVMARAKITMAQAITTAEQVTGGKAVGTGIEDQDGTVFLEVQVLKGDQRHKVLLDPQSGQVVKVVLEDDDDEKED